MEGRVSLFLIGAIAFLLLVTLVLGLLADHGRVLLLLSQELPQVPLKPLHAITPPPRHEQVRFDSASGPVVADLLVPTNGSRDSIWPALIVAHGIYLREDDRPFVLSFADTLARLGFLVLWPRGADLDGGRAGIENPETFVSSVQFLASRADVDRPRISFFGISVGSSIALVAAADPRIASSVRSLVSFGGYYDARAYLVDLASRSMLDNGIEVPWEPSEDAVAQAEVVVQAFQPAFAMKQPMPREAASSLLDAAPRAAERLRQISPADHLERVQAKVFILHDRGDPYVPHVQSSQLAHALPPQLLGQVLFTGLFQHARVREGFSREMAVDLAHLYGFAHTALNYF